MPLTQQTQRQASNTYAHTHTHEKGYKFFRLPRPGTPQTPLILQFLRMSSNTFNQQHLVLPGGAAGAMEDAAKWLDVCREAMLHVVQGLHLIDKTRVQSGQGQGHGRVEGSLEHTHNGLMIEVFNPSAVDIYETISCRDLWVEVLGLVVSHKVFVHKIVHLEHSIRR